MVEVRSKTEIFLNKTSKYQRKNGIKKYGYGNGITILIGLPYTRQQDQPWGVEVYNETKLRLISHYSFFKC